MKKLFISLLLLLVSVSCTEVDTGKDVNTPPHNDSAEFSFYDHVILFDKSYASSIDVVDATTINIDNSIDDEHYPQIGNIIYCTNNNDTPYGFIGRVVALTNNGTYTTYTTEEVLLTDIFEELHISADIELPKDIPYFIDSEGYIHECSSVDNNVWDTISEDSKKDDTDESATRATTDLKGSHTVKIAISNSGAFSGHLYINSLLSLKIDISSGKLEEFTYEYNKRCGIMGSLSLSAAKEKDFPLVNKTIMLPFSIAVGPLLLTTDFNIECGLKCSAQTSIEGGLSFEFDNSTTKFSYNNGSPTYEILHTDISQNKCMLLTRFETTIGMGLYFDTAMEMACYHRNILAVGAGVKGEYNISANNEITYSNTELLKINPHIIISPELEVGIFCRSNLFKWSGDDEEFGIYKEFGFEPFELPIFPEFYDFVTEYANNKIEATAQLVKNNYIKTTEEGFALFKRESDAALEHKKLSSATRNNGTSVSFDVDNQDDYVVKPYIISDDTYFYGEEYDDKWVDLGLSVLWAKYNVGATSPEEYGGYYAWGEISTKSTYEWGNYLHKDCESIFSSIVDTEYDVARFVWGNGARMPSLYDALELIQHCEWENSSYNGISGKVAVGPNGNSIFFPNSGIMVEDFHSPDGGQFWTGTPAVCEDEAIPDGMLYGAYRLDVTNVKCGIYWSRDMGLPIRPVKDK